MKTILNIAIVALLTLTIVSCKDDLPAGEGIPQIYVTGATTALPTAVETYSVGDAGSATWSVSDAAVASVSGSGSSADVTFLSPGDVRVTATIGSQTGYVDVRVSSVGAGVSVSYDKDGMLRKDSTGTVTFTFDAPLASDPLFGLKGTADAALITLGTFAGSADKYTVDVTGGTGNGTAMAYLRDVIVADNYGGDKADTIEVALFTIDNIQPNMKSFDQEGNMAGTATWGSDASVTVTFDEAMRPAMTDAGDTALWVYYDYNRDMSSTPGAMTDSVAMVTEDGITWTASLTVPDSISDGNGYTYSKIEGELLDLAGNEVLVDLSAPASYTIDITAPGQPTTGGSELNNEPTGTGEQRYITLTASSTDASSVVYYYEIIDASITEKDAEAIPTSLDDFSGDSNSGTVTKLMSTDSARYDVFWIAVDEFGYESDVDSARIFYNNMGEFSYNVDNN